MRATPLDCHFLTWTIGSHLPAVDSPDALYDGTCRKIGAIVSRPSPRLRRDDR